MSEEKRDIVRFLRMMVDMKGSDLHIKSGSTAKIRIDGKIAQLTREMLAPQAVESILNDLMSEEIRKRLSSDHEVDFLFQIRNLGRFRVNVYKQMMGLAIAIRHIRIDIPTIESLMLPKILYEMIDRPRGLIFITGATGSGKSTALAAMIEALNQTRELNIITVEDPIEFAFKEKRCTIQQREIGRDTPSWSEALRRIMRQDPDVIMLGEVRDSETMITALTAANTGHLVLATLHTMDATQTVNRVLSFALPESATQVRNLLAATLVGVVSLRLLLRAGDSGRVPAVETLIATETIRKMILDPQQTMNIRAAIADGAGQYGMQTFDQSLMKLCRAKVITIEEALKNASSPTDFKIQLRGLDGKNLPDWNQFAEAEPDKGDSKKIQRNSAGSE